MFKLLRENRITESNPKGGQLLFAKMICQAANENLTDFFGRWEFFEPVNNVKIEQCVDWNYNVSLQMISDAKAFMAKFPAPKHALYFSFEVPSSVILEGVTIYAVQADGVRKVVSPK